jgi:hypothetical protein
MTTATPAKIRTVRHQMLRMKAGLLSKDMERLKISKLATA